MLSGLYCACIIARSSSEFRAFCAGVPSTALRNALSTRGVSSSPEGSSNPCERARAANASNFSRSGWSWIR